MTTGMAHVTDVTPPGSECNPTSCELTRSAIDAAAGAVAPEMNSQDIANLLWAYGTLGSAPGGHTWAALDTAAGRVHVS